MNADQPTTTQQEPTTVATDEKLEEIRSDKTYRVGLDQILQSLKTEKPSRERALAITKIQEAIMWLGMDLKRIGSGEPPYPHSYDPTSPIVDPVADGLKL